MFVILCEEIGLMEVLVIVVYWYGVDVVNFVVFLCVVVFEMFLLFEMKIEIVLGVEVEFLVKVVDLMLEFVGVKLGEVLKIFEVLWIVLGFFLFKEDLLGLFQMVFLVVCVVYEYFG